MQEDFPDVSKTESVSSEQPQDGSNTFTEDDEGLTPIIATDFGICDLCRSYIERGEGIVTADGTQWTHEACARQAGWTIAGDS